MGASTDASLLYNEVRSYYILFSASGHQSAYSTLLSASTSTGTSSTRLPERLLLLRLPACPHRVYRNVFCYYVYRHVHSASSGTSSALKPSACLQRVYRHVYSTFSGTSTACLLPDLLRSESSTPGATQPSHDAAALEYDSATPEPATESSFESRHEHQSPAMTCGSAILHCSTDSVTGNQPP